MIPHINALDHLVLTVADIGRTVAFYEALGMVAEEFTPADGSTRTALKFGPHKINLHQKGHEFMPHAQSAVPGSADLCFLSDSPPEAWVERLQALGIAIEEGPVCRTGATGPLMSVYIRDPDLNLIEIAHPLSG